MKRKMRKESAKEKLERERKYKRETNEGKRNRKESK